MIDMTPFCSFKLLRVLTEKSIKKKKKSGAMAEAHYDCIVVGMGICGSSLSHALGTKVNH
jgi:hypothetical protein